MNPAPSRQMESFIILDHSPIGHFVLDQEFSVLFWNRCLADWTGIPREKIIGCNILEIFPHLGEAKYRNRIAPISGAAPPPFFLPSCTGTLSRRPCRETAFGYSRPW